MTTILLYGSVCTFNGEVWKCSPDDGDVDEVLERMLNDSFDPDTVVYGDGYKVSKYDKTVTGVDAIALDAISIFEPVVINHSEYELPTDAVGVLW